MHGGGKQEIAPALASAPLGPKADPRTREGLGSNIYGIFRVRGGNTSCNGL
jgi:hypothetical protein